MLKSIDAERRLLTKVRTQQFKFIGYMIQGKNLEWFLLSGKKKGAVSVLIEESV